MGFGGCGWRAGWALGGSGGFEEETLDARRGGAPFLDGGSRGLRDHRQLVAGRRGGGDFLQRARRRGFRFGGFGLWLLAFDLLSGLGELIAQLKGFHHQEFPLAGDGALGWFGEFLENELGLGMGGEEREGGLTAATGGFGVEDGTGLDVDEATDVTGSHIDEP